MAWTEETSNLAIALAGQGYSASQIAGELFIQHRLTVSRNAVIGRVHRLGHALGELRRENKKKIRKVAGPRAKSAQPRLRNRGSFFERLKDMPAAPTMPPAPSSDDQIPRAQRRTIMTLTYDS